MKWVGIDWVWSDCRLAVTVENAAVAVRDLNGGREQGRAKADGEISRESVCATRPLR